MNDQKPPAKKAKTEGDVKDASNKLTSLLVQLNGGKTLDLKVRAAISTAASGESITGVAKELMDATLQTLFENHVGQSPEAVVQNAIDRMNEIYSVEVDRFNEAEAIWGGNCFGVDQSVGMFDCPMHPLIKGPRPDMKVWLALFLGVERAEKLLDGRVPMCKMYRKGSPAESEEEILLRAFKGEVTDLPLIDLMTNVLSYVREKVEKIMQSGDEELEALLRFAVIYGLDGVMKNILQGAYGDTKGLTIDTLLPLTDEPLEEHLGWMWWLPPMHMGAILGHSNVVLGALGLGGKIDAPMGSETSERAIQLSQYHSPTTVLEWIILKNKKQMLQILVKDCGFQFRWMSRDRQTQQISKPVFSRIFDLSQYESDPMWKGELRFEDYMWENSRVKCQMRAASAYKEQMLMLDHLIELGFPFELLFPTEPGVDELERLHQNKQLETRQQNREYMLSLSKNDRLALENLTDMTRSYNCVQQDSSDSDTDESHQNLLSVSGYYYMLKKRWDGKQSQLARLPEFEGLDPTWRAEQEPSNPDDHDDDDDTDHYDDDTDHYDDDSVNPPFETFEYDDDDDYDTDHYDWSSGKWM